ncbi:MAG: TIR domain-containing protein [Anaerolineales bacterium]
MPETEFKFDVFLSHNGKDKPAVENIARLLRDEYSLKAWLDKWNLIPGEAWQEALEDALDECETFAVFLGPSGIGPWENEEMRSAISDRVQDKSRRVIPVLLPGAPDNKDLDLPRFLKRATWVDFRSGLDDKEALYRLYCGITGQAPGDRGTSNSFKTPTTADWHLAHPYSMPPNFTGRADELKMLDDWLVDNTNRLFILRALGGFGKSALAWQWINTHVNPAEWTKLVWWSFYEGDASVEHFIEDTLKYLNLEVPQGGRLQVDKLLKVLQSQKILIILDGFERVLRLYGDMNAVYQSEEGHKIEDYQLDCKDINAEWLLKGICSLPNLNSKVLMTTRLSPRSIKVRDEPLQGCREDELNAMQKSDAVDFFHKQKIEGTHSEIEAACAPYGYHPLSLRILTGLIIGDREKPGDITVVDKLDITTNIIQNKNHVLKVSYETLSLGQQKLLSNMACFRSTISYQALKFIINKPSWKRKNRFGLNEKLDESLQTLETRGLLSWNRQSNKYDLHPIVRRYAYQQLTTSDRVIAHRRLRDYFASFPKSKHIEKIEDLMPVIELYHHTVRTGEFDEARQLFSDRLQVPLYYQIGAYQTIIELLSTLFPEGESKLPHLKDEGSQAWVLNGLANSYSLNGQSHRAIPLFEQSIKLRERNNERLYISEALINMADDQLKIGAFLQGEHNLYESTSINQELGLDEDSADRYSELGRHLSYRGDFAEAEILFDKAQGSFEEQKGPQNYLGINNVYKSLRFLLMIRSNPLNKEVSQKSAIKYALYAREFIEERVKDKQFNMSDLIRTYWILGAAYRENNDLEKAEIYLDQALIRDRSINMVDHKSYILLELARLRYIQKNYEEAKAIADEALLITERCGYVLQGADVNLFLAQYAFEQEKDKAKAKQYAEEAKKLATCDGPPYYYKVAYEEAERFLENLK